jgi:hypothetical protein
MTLTPGPLSRKRKRGGRQQPQDKKEQGGRKAAPPIHSAETKGDGTMKEYTIIDGWVTYMPEFDGNRDDPEPITVEILPMTVREAKTNASKITAERVKGFRNRIRTNQAEISTETFRRHVRNVRNLTFNGTAVTTADELLDTNLVELVSEIEDVINDFSILNEGDVKNFRSQSAGSRERTPGTATTAPTSADAPVTAEGTTEGTTDRR